MCQTSRHIVAILGSIGESMKSALAKLSVCIGLAVIAMTIIPHAAHAKDVVGQCSRLEKKAAKQAKAIKRIIKSKRKVSPAMMKGLKTARRKYSVECEREPVCADMNNAICESVGGDFCVQMVRPQTFSSIAKMVQAGGNLLYEGACSDNFNFGVPMIVGGN